MITPLSMMKTNNLPQWKQMLAIQVQSNELQTQSTSCIHKGQHLLPTANCDQPRYICSMCSTGLALDYPKALLLLKWTMNWCTANTGLPWILEQMEEAVAQRLHDSTIIDIFIVAATVITFWYHVYLCNYR